MGSRRSFLDINAEEFRRRSAAQLERLEPNVIPFPQPATPPPIPLVQSVALGTDLVHRVVLLTLGQAPIALRAAFSPAECRQIAAAFLQHAEMLEPAPPDDTSPGPEGDAA